ncbi:hypothetical protein E1281_24700 [Actinomadura sp. KC345]|uniref:hypothetical protein n=1 Tax=Actinomadura sp. KC345 TaxID=2530371 RepID=UPI0010438CE7|nr:hypothetical protein [Actinomadura sp. KC345]TDC48468.1 hypothetical protein E1281_24700 [Actinomadura sp. KC345]
MNVLVGGFLAGRRAGGSPVTGHLAVTAVLVILSGVHGRGTRLFRLMEAVLTRVRRSVMVVASGLTGSAEEVAPGAGRWCSQNAR